MASIDHLSADVVPTQTGFSPALNIDRTTTDTGGGGITVGEQGQFVYSPPAGRWTLYITHLKTHYPMDHNDFKDGDEVHWVQSDGVQFKGTIALHSHMEQVGTYWMTTYYYTSDITKLTP